MTDQPGELHKAFQATSAIEQKKNFLAELSTEIAALNKDIGLATDGHVFLTPMIGQIDDPLSQIRMARSSASQPTSFPATVNLTFYGAESGHRLELIIEGPLSRETMTRPVFCEATLAPTQYGIALPMVKDTIRGLLTPDEMQAYEKVLSAPRALTGNDLRSS